ncbi:DNase I-like protein [Hymenopellis radicata]|nr:DNase I-like protein [Hymenopellis radicata]
MPSLSIDQVRYLLYRNNTHHSHHSATAHPAPTLPHLVPPRFVKPPIPHISHSQSSSSNSSNSSHDPFFDQEEAQSPDTVAPIFTSRPNDDSLIDLGSPRSSTSSLSSPDSEISQHSAPLTKPHRIPPPRPPPRHRSLAIEKPTQSTPPSLSLNAAAPPLPQRRPTIATPVDEEPPRLPNRPVSAQFSPAPAASPVNDRRVFGKHLPPPTRIIALGDKLPEVRKLPSGDDSDDESEDEEDMKGTGVDMLPDSSRSSRRPPRMQDVHDGYNIYNPIKVGAYSGHVRMSGTQVVVAEGHKIRIYDLSVQDSPIWVLDSKEVGVKSVTIQSIEFRSGGRFVWAGTKEGHVLEADVKSGQFTGVKLNGHLNPVVHIFRHADTMVTVDDGGKVLVWLPDAGETEIRLSHTLPRVVRITEKLDFAKLIGGMLWTASRNDKMGGHTPAKVPIIRVYDIFTPGCVGRTVLPTGHVGAVTSAAILPSDPKHAYLGHEEGYITIWDLETDDRYPRCVEVMKVSLSDILCLEGVYNRLWAGSRSGTISAYDVAPRPWVVTNCWNPHPGMPVMKLQVDLFGVEKTGRLCVLSLSRDEVLMLWDGLLSLDWMDQDLMKHEQSFSTFRDLKVLVVSWNCDAAKPDHLNGDPANINLLHDILTSVDSPDIISFGFQEVIDLESRKMAAKNIVLTAASSKKHEEGVLPGLSEKVTGAYRRWFDRLLLAVRLAMPPDCPYTCIHTESLVGLFTCIFIKNTERVTLRDMAISTIKRGMGGRYGNKGGIVARLVIEDSSICFINCHLAAGQNHVRTRNADVTGILEEKNMFPATNSEPVAFVGGGDGSAVTDHEIVFLNGDMNYRIDQRRDNIVNAVRSGEWDSMLSHDQLLKEIKYNRGCRLRVFSEGPLTFPPTYKYDRRSDEYDSSEKRRSPAWCDRVLWRSKIPTRVEQLHYRRYEANVSDHRPISGAFRMTVKSVRHEVRQKYKLQVQMKWADEELRLLHTLRTYFAEKQLV